MSSVYKSFNCFHWDAVTGHELEATYSLLSSDCLKGLGW